MTVAVVGTAGRAAATRAAAAGGSRSGAGRVIDGHVVNSRPARAASSSASSSRGSGLLGDTLGGLASGSAISRGMKSPRTTTGPGTPARRVLVAEFAVCMVVLALSPVTDRKRTEGPGAFMKRASAVMAVFFTLGLIASGGRGAARAAAGFGGLVTLTLLISSRSLFVVLAGKVGTSAGEHPDDPEVPEETEGAGSGVGGAAGHAVGDALDALDQLGIGGNG